MKYTLKQFVIMLQDHDWSYQYSEDSKYWERGRSQAEEIAKARRYFKENCVEHAAIASVLFDEYRPAGL
tara:strand:- start:2291 stop:2497 length:207 start_codon:yes stop_codon:yes gene_type:complete